MKKFDLTKAAGLDRIVSNLDTMEITQIPLDLIDTNEKNFFSVDDVQDLMESIQVNGILQPLNVVRAGDRYRIIAGHRRFKAAGEAGLKEVPAIVLPDMSESMEWFMLIKTNTTTRELSHAEKTEAAIRMKKHLVQMKAEGVKITGRLRDIVAEQMEISKTELARMEVIDKKLSDEFKSLWKSNSIDASCAYELAKLSPEDQETLLLKMTRNGCRMSTPIVKDFVLQQKCKAWACQDCPYPLTDKEREQRGKGFKFPCHHLERLQIRHWSSDGACTCCANCGKAFKCLDACSGAKVAACKENREKQIAKEREAAAAAKQEQDIARAEHFNATPFANIGKAVIPLVDKGGISLEDIAEWWTDRLNELLPDEQDFDSFDESDVASMLYAKTIDDVDWPLAAFVAFCDAVNRTPNALLGYEDKPSKSIWNPYPATCPDDRQKVVVFREVLGMTITNDAIYWNGDFYIYDEDFDPEYDEPANFPGIIAWTEFPDWASI